jgi:hypothetical protein
VSTARFLLLYVSTPTPDGRTQDRVVWRLVAGNNHVLGRAPEPCDDVAACMTALARLQHELPSATTGLAPDSRPGRYGWRVTSGSQVLAVSSRWYERQRESRYSLQQFLAAAPTAPISPTVAARPRSREIRRAELRVPRAASEDAPVVPARLVPVPRTAADALEARP